MTYIGAHISREKTLLDTIKQIQINKGNALQIFVSNPRSAKITQNNIFIKEPHEIKKFIKNNNFSLVIHSPYIINLASKLELNKRVLDISDSYVIQLLIHELKIAHTLGAIGCIVHCGKYTKQTIEEGLFNMKNTLVFIINEIIKLKLNSKIILETSCGQGTELLSNYNDFLDFYNSFTKEQKEYFKICIDTCHVWSAGYELNDIYEITKNNNNLNDIAVIHVNNSKNPKNSKLDRHEYLEEGLIKLENILEFIKNIKKYNSKITLILEKPNDNYSKEFNLIK
jgi:deoxyribonuclease-4